MDGTISDRWLMRDTDSEDMTSYSVMVNNDGFSKGKHLGFFETMSCKQSAILFLIVL